MMFTLGPVLMHGYTKEVGGMQLPYFRTEKFSDVVKNTTQLYNTASCAHPLDQTIILSCSGTGAMEATIINCLTENTKVLVINGGAFGERWVELCRLHNIPHDVITVPFDKNLGEDMLMPFRNKGYFALLVNIHETGIGKLYDANMLSRFCVQEGMYFFVDAISSLFADEFKINSLNPDITIVSSQKALALAPGLSIVTISQRLFDEVIVKNKRKSMYFDFSDCIKNAKRGQTPFTPAIGIIFQLERRLEKILEQGVDNVVKDTKQLADYFRQKVTALPVEICKFNLSNAMTPIMLKRGNAREVILKLADKYGIAINASQEIYADKMIRIGHIGALEKSHYDKLIDALTVEIR